MAVHWHMLRKGKRLKLKRHQVQQSPRILPPSDSEPEENEDAQSLAEQPANTSNDEDVPPKEEAGGAPKRY